MAEYHKYSLKQNRFKRSFLTGFSINENTLCCKEESSHRMFVSDGIDGIEAGALWGRLHIDWKLESDMVITVYAAATDIKTLWQNDKSYTLEELLHDPERPMEQKRRLMEQLGAKKAINQTDLLLYEQEGRYLYILVEVYGMGKGTLCNMFVDNKGDFFMDTFPEVYREYGSFFHRYMSVFSSLYMDFQDKIDHVSEFLDVDTAPAELLPIFGQWMGLDVSGDFLSEDRLRLLIKEAYALNRMKGTKTALARVCEIVLDEKVIILEKNVIHFNTQAGDKKLYENLYGEGIYDVTLLIHTYVPENQKSQLMFLLNQFKPVRSRLKIKYLEPSGNLDGHVYMDINAYVGGLQAGVLDERIGLDGNILLKE